MALPEAEAPRTELVVIPTALMVLASNRRSFGPSIPIKAFHGGGLLGIVTIIPFSGGGGFLQAFCSLDLFHKLDNFACPWDKIPGVPFPIAGIWGAKEWNAQHLVMRHQTLALTERRQILKVPEALKAQASGALVC